MIYNLCIDNRKDINNLINIHDNIIILFYSISCYHCNNLNPVWNKLCKYVENNKDIAIINAEYSNINNLKKKFQNGVTGFPTILKFCKGLKINEYNGNRNFEDLKKFVKK